MILCFCLNTFFYVLSLDNSPSQISNIGTAILFSFVSTGFFIQAKLYYKIAGLLKGDRKNVQEYIVLPLMVTNLFPMVSGGGVNEFMILFSLLSVVVGALVSVDALWRYKRISNSYWPYQKLEDVGEAALTKERFKTLLIISTPILFMMLLSFRSMSL